MLAVNFIYSFFLDRNIILSNIKYNFSLPSLMQTQHSIHTIAPKKVFAYTPKAQPNINQKLIEINNSGNNISHRQFRKRSIFSLEKKKQLQKVNSFQSDEVQQISPYQQPKIIGNIDIQSNQCFQNNLREQPKIHSKPQISTTSFQNKKNKTHDVRSELSENTKNLNGISKNKHINKPFTPRLNRKNTDIKFDVQQKRDSDKNTIPSIYKSQYFRPLKMTKSFNEEIDSFFENNFKDKLSTKQSERDEDTEFFQKEKNSMQKKVKEEIRQEKVTNEKKIQEKWNKTKIVSTLVFLCLLLILVQIFV